jgi:hypothetical protein
MKTFDEKQSKRCPIAREWALNSSPSEPYCDDCYVTNTNEKTTCQGAILQNWQRLFDLIERGIF